MKTEKAIKFLFGNNKPKEIEKEIIKKWNKLGFLDRVKNKRNVALAYEYLALYMMDSKNKKRFIGDEQTLLFPVVRKIFSNYKGKLDKLEIWEGVITIADDFTTKYSKAEPKIKKTHKLNGSDSEAEFCNKYSDNYIKNTNNH